MPKIDEAVKKIMHFIPDEIRVSLTQAIETGSQYGETGNGQIMATNIDDYAEQYLNAYFYDRLAGVYDIED